MSDPFRKIFWFTAGDFVAKAASFLAFIYLARTLGVEPYGTLEFALAVLAYMVKVADGGLEMWALRAAAQGEPIEEVASRVVPLRLLLGVGTFVAFMVATPLFPAYPGLRGLITVLGLAVLIETGNLRWVFMGQERLRRVAIGQMLGQLLFLGGVLVFVAGPEAIVAVAVLRVVTDLVVALFFLVQFHRRPGRKNFRPRLRGAGALLREALPFGLTHLLGLAAYSLDTVLLGFLADARAVGLYNAAYRPVTVGLAIPLAYFHGLFPVLSRTLAEGPGPFLKTVDRSLRLAAIGAVGLGVGVTFLAEPGLDFLFGETYRDGVIALTLLGWSGALVVLRGTFRQGLLAGGHQRLDLQCSGLAVSVNLVLNLILIPRFGVEGAAAATLLSEVVWMLTARTLFRQHLGPLSVSAAGWRPALAGLAMAFTFLLAAPWPWVVRGVLATGVFAGVLAALGTARTIRSPGARS